MVCQSSTGADSTTRFTVRSSLTLYRATGPSTGIYGMNLPRGVNYQCL